MKRLFFFENPTSCSLSSYLLLLHLLSSSFGDLYSVWLWAIDKGHGTGIAGYEPGERSFSGENRNILGTSSYFIRCHLSGSVWRASVFILWRHVYFKVMWTVEFDTGQRVGPVNDCCSIGFCFWFMNRPWGLFIGCDGDHHGWLCRHHSFLSLHVRNRLMIFLFID